MEEARRLARLAPRARRAGLRRRGTRWPRGSVDRARPRRVARRDRPGARSARRRARPRSSDSTSAPRLRRCTTPGLLHRDVKAQNVMREAGGRIVLMDFGTGEDSRRHQPPGRHAALPRARDLRRTEGVGPERHLQRRRHALLSRDRRISRSWPRRWSSCERAHVEPPASTAARPAAGRARGLHPRRRTRARQRSVAALSQRSASSSRACASRWIRCAGPRRHRAMRPRRSAPLASACHLPPRRALALIVVVALHRLDPDTRRAVTPTCGHARGCPAVQGHLERSGGRRTSPTSSPIS